MPLTPKKGLRHFSVEKIKNRTKNRATVHGISERQGFHSPVAIRKLAVTKFYPDLLKLRNSSGASAFVKLQIY